jgi:hypothetical protein
MKNEQEWVGQFARESKEDSLLGLWCTVLAMSSTGMCAKCVVEDSINNWHTCPNPECANHAEYFKRSQIQ